MPNTQKENAIAAPIDQDLLDMGIPAEMCWKDQEGEQRIMGEYVARSSTPGLLHYYRRDAWGDLVYIADFTSLAGLMGLIIAGHS